MLKETINADFVTAFKAKDMVTKNTLGMLKSKITETEKKNGKEADETAILAAVQSEIKKRQQTIDILKEQQSKMEADEAGILDNSITVAGLEIEVLQKYLPKQFTREEIESLLKTEMLNTAVLLEGSKVVGHYMKLFKERYNGQYDAKLLKDLVEDLHGLKK